MKTFLAAIAMTIAIPAAAQTANPAANPHAGHAPVDHSKMDHSKHSEGREGENCCDHKTAEGKAMGCCDKAKDGAAVSAGKMACCEKHAAAAGAAEVHAGHDMGKH